MKPLLLITLLLVGLTGCESATTRLTRQHLELQLQVQKVAELQLETIKVMGRNDSILNARIRQLENQRIEIINH